MRITIDDESCQAREGQTVLEVAQAHGIHIPALCDHPTFGHYGGCRLCCVELAADRPDGSGRGWHLVSACTTKVETGMVVRTASERIGASRRMTVALLSKRLEGGPVLDMLRGECGADERLEGIEVADVMGEHALKDCLLCGLCVRACARTGRYALAMCGRGSGRHVVKPAFRGSTTCNDCGLCQRVCPTGAINFLEAQA